MRKPKTRSKTKPKAARKIPRIRIDLSEWELGDWPLDISKLVKVDKSAYSVDISLNLDSDAFEPIASKIAKEAIEAFFDPDTMFWHLYEDGLHIESDAGDLKQTVKIPFEFIGLRGGIEVFDRIREWMKEQLQEYGSEDKDGQERIIAEYRKQGLEPPTFNKWGEQVLKEAPDG